MCWYNCTPALTHGLMDQRLLGIVARINFSRRVPSPYI